jgi:hypothetical protein
MTVISGVTGEVDTYISQPIGMFVKGLAALEPNSPTSPAKLRSTAGFVGQSNVAIIGSNPVHSDLTAIGSPMVCLYSPYSSDTPLPLHAMANNIPHRIIDLSRE